MKKKTAAQELIRIKRLKKHNKDSLSARFRARRAKRQRKHSKAPFMTELNTVQLNEAEISNEMSNMVINRSLDRVNNLKSFTFPKVFDIFSDPEGALSTINELRSVLLHPHLSQKLKLNHKKVKINSLGSEALLGLLTSEIVSRRRHQLGENLEIEGRFPNDKIAKALVERIGLVCELDDDAFQDASNTEHDSDYHLFRADNRYHEGASVKQDKKRKVATDCVDYLEKCMNSHRLTIKSEAQDRMVACLGEVLDNANEHCGRTKSLWYVRGYFNDIKSTDCKSRYLELTVMNFGNSISENFLNLPDDSKVKRKAKTYVDRHSNKVSEDALFTVAALQGSMSSKLDKEPTRGQGSVTLIETFESIYNDYCALRDPSGRSKARAVMNIISGRTVVTFDGRHQSKVVEKAGGGEVFQMAFNESQSLADSPDHRNVSTMKNIHFPGLMINIRIPLQGSTVPLEGVEND
ncbi:hypothetical protein D8T32_14110 [Vibrio vulnificus]|uniref:hypothetical protein n=1 Tax=Vibrio vulnificus TaxID=672 RepID=UPI001023E707|nr:hypothetical protein [Vibrio vulnificus]EGR0752063.1 hypothetical protein [Vibrio vulnificus]ELV8692077.1 hypothetical protein [Vibrio vulnificus]MDK2616743.1 hypothetical protein [Vibrio vulnificus]MDK2673903.1 hypothetical protein [Vibrio vulnificus]RZQ25336.1 hypothetical protein D8T36_13790 [Vibrio vulnificus]